MVRQGNKRIVGIEKATEIHTRYGPLDFLVDAEDMAKREGLTITTWSQLPPVVEVKVVQESKHISVSHEG